MGHFRQLNERVANMFTDDLTMYNYKEGVNPLTFNIYSEIDRRGPDNSKVRVVAPQPTGHQREMRIAHSVVGKEGTPTISDRHLVSFSKSILDPTTGRQHTAVVNLTIQFPRSGLIPESGLFNLIENLLSLLSGGKEFDLDASLLNAENVRSLLYGMS